MIQPLNRTSDPAQTVAITSNICGGLGNQMLQYAAGRALSLRLDCPLILDLSFYDRGRHRQFELDRFPIEADWNRSDRHPRMGRLLRAFRPKDRLTPVYAEQSKNFDPAFHSITAPTRLDGYFFSEKYFIDQAESIRQELRPPTPSDRRSTEIQQRMANHESTALHIRRGDYVTNKKASDRFWSCTIEYYEQAMERIDGDGTVFVFSDDIEWAKANLKPVKRLEFVDADPTQDGLRDMWLMTHAHHHIIANSSFSWWGAWLAAPDKGATIAPAKWFNDSTIDDSDMIPDQWIRI